MEVGLASTARDELTNLLVGLFALGDIAGDTHQPDNVTLPIAQRHLGGEHPARIMIICTDALLAIGVDDDRYQYAHIEHAAPGTRAVRTAQ